MKNSVISTILLICLILNFQGCWPFDPKPDKVTFRVKASENCNGIAHDIEITIDGSYVGTTQPGSSGISKEVSKGNHTYYAKSASGHTWGPKTEYVGSEGKTVNLTCDPRDLAFKGISVSETDDADIPYVAIDENGNYMAIMTNSNQTAVKGAVFVSNDGKEFTVHTDDNGYPRCAYMEGYIILYANYTQNTVDVAVINPTGDIKIFREVPADLTEFAAKASSPESFRELLRGAGIALSVAACVAGYISAPAGIGVPVAIACTAALVNIILNIVESDMPEVELSSGAFGVFAGIIGCASSEPFACASFVAHVADLVWTAVNSSYEDRADEVALAEAALIHGHGDVQVTLTWDNEADLDLWVTDPAGETIWWYHPYSASGGQLDVDDRDGYGPENIFWPEGQAPAGTYVVQVHYYDGVGTANFRVLLQASGQTNEYRGSISLHELIDVVTFNTGRRSLPTDVEFKVKRHENRGLPPK